MKKISALLLSITMVLLLSGCGDKLKGTYILSSMESMGIEMNYADLEMMGDMDATIECEKEDEVELSLDGDTITCKIDVDKETIEIEGETMSFKVDDEQIIISGGDEEIEVKMVFTKEDSSKWKEIKEEKGNFSDFE